MREANIMDYNIVFYRRNDLRHAAKHHKIEQISMFNFEPSIIIKTDAIGIFLDISITLENVNFSILYRPEKIRLTEICNRLITKYTFLKEENYIPNNDPWILTPGSYI